jgi:hypothetical protein
MDPLSPAAADDVADMVMSMGYDCYDPVETLILGHPYRVRSVIGRQYEIFLVVDRVHELFNEVRVVTVPQRCHESIRKLTIMLRTHSVKECYFENVGRTLNGDIILRAFGDGFDEYV